MKHYLTLALALLLTLSCGEIETDAVLLHGTYKCEAKHGSLVVSIQEKGKCDVSFSGETVYSGTYFIDRSTIVIKGFATKPYDYAKPGTITEDWRYIYTFTGNMGTITSPSSFNYFVQIQEPFEEKKGVTLTFTKQ